MERVIFASLIKLSCVLFVCFIWVKFLINPVDDPEDEDLLAWVKFKAECKKNLL